MARKKTTGAKTRTFTFTFDTRPELKEYEVDEVELRRCADRFEQLTHDFEREATLDSADYEGHAVLAARVLRQAIASGSVAFTDPRPVLDIDLDNATAAPWVRAWTLYLHTIEFKRPIDMPPMMKNAVSQTDQDAGVTRVAGDPLSPREMCSRSVRLCKMIKASIDAQAPPPKPAKLSDIITLKEFGEILGLDPRTAKDHGDEYGLRQGKSQKQWRCDLNKLSPPQMHTYTEIYKRKHGCSTN